MFKLAVLVLAVCFYNTQASVIRTTEKDIDLLETTTVNYDPTTTLEPEVTTVAEDDLTTTTTERFGAFSRDEEASILLLDQTLLEPLSADLAKTELQSVQIEKSAKLLLLSTPKIAEKPKQLEENLEESEEEEGGSGQNVTEIDLETTTTSATTEENEATTTMTLENEVDKQTTESSVEDMMVTTEKTTKLYPINDTLYEDQTKSNSENPSLVNNDQTNKMSNPENPALVVVDEPKESLNSNFGSIVLQESESDYVLLDAEILEGSYADADSALHLQPIVQSVEFVPSSFDDPLLINYVQSW